MVLVFRFVLRNLESQYLFVAKMFSYICAMFKRLYRRYLLMRYQRLFERLLLSCPTNVLYPEGLASSRFKCATGLDWEDVRRELRDETIWIARPAHCESSCDKQGDEENS